jgi:ABC-type polysaccharide/polyol phosphate export permease
MLNPMTPIIEGYREVILNGQLPAAGPLGAAAAGSIALFGVAWLLFHRAEYKFAENA